MMGGPTVLELIFIALIGATAVAVVTVVVLTFLNIIEWFRSRNDLHISDRDNLAFTIEGLLDSGQYRRVGGVFNQTTNKYNIIQGIYNRRTHTVADHRPIAAERLDTSIRRLHEAEPLVIYD
jgi:hypothetical protein